MKVFFPNLDGLRFLSCLGVFFCHSLLSTSPNITSSAIYSVPRYLLSNGHLGVQFFFVLSGFLITFLLLAEKDHSGKIHIPGFYLRRVLRIWPLYYFNVFFGFILFPILKTILHEVPNETANPWYFVFFMANFNVFENGGPDSSLLAILWSVSVEEQFYLIWPVFLSLIPTSFLKNMLYLLMGVLVAVVLGWHLPGMHSLHSFIPILLGALCAHYSYYHSGFLSFFETLSGVWIKCIYIIGAVVFFNYNQLYSLNPALECLFSLGISCFFAFIILEQNYATQSFYKVSRWKTISHWGNYTYSFYCLHMIGILVAKKGLDVIGVKETLLRLFLMEVPLGFVLSLLISYLSYTYFEMPFLRLKKKFQFIKKE